MIQKKKEEGREYTLEGFLIDPLGVNLGGLARGGSFRAHSTNTEGETMGGLARIIWSRAATQNHRQQCRGGTVVSLASSEAPGVITGPSDFQVIYHHLNGGLSHGA